jgi:predicted ATPase/class 3 adenylate cyclase
MGEPPRGTVTFLFTDLEGSSRLWQDHPAAMGEALTRHDEILRRVIEERRGYLFKATGDGVYAAFERATDAVGAALAAQVALTAELWKVGALAVRMALHAGAAEEREGDYHGPALNRCARLLDAAHGGQVLLSLAAEELVREEPLPEGATLRDLGQHRLRDLAHPEHVFELLHPKLEGEFPPLRSLEVHPHNLPVQLTSFIGRERELTEIRKRLGETRLLTLVGVGGSGKTRLALQVAGEALGEYPDGAWLVELAPLTDAELVPQTVATALGVKEQPGRSFRNALLDALRSKRPLVLLDNCEHLIQACAALAEELLQGSPDLVILATSREGLGVGGEVLWQVPSLGLPQSSLPPAEAIAEDALRLFADRASAVRPDFQVNAENSGDVIEICRRLDGMPLAIELAAARVKVLPVSEIASRLHDRFRLLTGGRRTALPRQQTLEAAVGWSYELLDEPERKLFIRLSVFAGGFTLSAAEVVCAGEGIEVAAVLDLLSHLVDKSLVVAEESRYRLLETLRQYGEQKLAGSGEAEAVRDRHRNFFLALAEEAEPHLRSPEADQWVERLEREHDNLRAALEWSLESGQADALQRHVVPLSRFWEHNDYHTEGREWLEKALAQEAWASSRLRAYALLGLVVFVRTYDYRRAEEMAGEALDLLREAEDASGTAEALSALADAVWYRDDFQRAAELAGESLALFRRLDDEWGISESLTQLARAKRDQGDSGRALELFEEAVQLAPSLSEARIINVLMHLAVVVWYEGDPQRATELLEEAMALSRKKHRKWEMAHVLRRLGEVEASSGRHAQALPHLEESLPLLHEIGDKHCAALALTTLGSAWSRQGDRPRATGLLHEALLLNQDLGAKGAIAGSLSALAELAAADEASERAAQLLGSADALRRSVGSPLPPPEAREYEYQIAAVRAELGPEAFSVAWEKGRAMSEEEAVSYAVSA